MGRNGRSSGGLAVFSRNSEVAAYPSGPVGGDREAPPAALYLGRLAPNTRGPARYRLERMAEVLSGGTETALSLPWHRVS
jgi:hypothetical protein